MSSLYERIKSELELVSGSDKNTNYYKFIEEVNNIIDKYPKNSVKVGLDLILKSWSWKPWSSINLSKENFDKTGKHKRAWYIQKDNIGIYNVLAYLLRPRRSYTKLENNEIIETINSPIFPDWGEIIDERIYISRGGIINGDYIHKCYIKHNGFHSVKDSIKIPVSSIEMENDVNFILFVDHREPKLKALMEFYNVPIKHDDNVKYNVRTFKKLK